MPRASYKKTIYVFALAAALSFAIGGVALALIPSVLGVVIAAGSLLLGALLSLVVVSGLVVLDRESRLSSHRTDLFVEKNQSLDEDGVLRRPAGTLGSKMRRLISGQQIVVGDVVEVLSPEEIAATLDEKGCLEGLPFQPEMLPYCGRQFRVFRNIDKILDYGNTKGMRRMKRAVSLVNIRCDGGSHDGCQARCYLLWKHQWLRRVPPGSPENARNPDPAALASLRKRLPTQVTPAEQPIRYFCQFTRAAPITTPIASGDVLAYVRPMLTGNVTFGAFFVATSTRLFNRVQKLRGGIPYPLLPPSERTSTPTAAEGIEPGTRVRVRDTESIAATLDRNGKNRGMGFTSEMQKYCGKEYLVDGAIRQFIDDASARMVTVKHPCLILKGANSSGETEKLCGQHELVYWRELWLEKRP